MAHKVLLLAYASDLHADAVADHCAMVGIEAIRVSPLDLVNNEADVSFAVDPGSNWWKVTSRDRAIDSTTSHALYCRDWEIPAPPSTEDLERAVAAEESASFLQGFAAMLPAHRCVDHPFIQRHFENKLVQIPLARAAGLAVPATISTNDPDFALQFLRQRRSAIKLLSNVSFTGMEGLGEFVFTSEITESAVSAIGDVRNCPIFLQEVVEKIADVRVTVVGDRMFSAILWPNGYEAARVLDWRERNENKLEQFELSEGMSEKIGKLMRSMNLVFGAIDFGLKSDGSLTFFEINATGNWLWLERDLGFPISLTIAEKLGSI